MALNLLTKETSCHPAATCWPDLWLFLSLNQQPRTYAFRAHVSASPAYFLTKALVVLSLRKELAQRFDQTYTPRPLESSGASSALFVELAQTMPSAAVSPLSADVVTLAPRFTKNF